MKNRFFLAAIILACMSVPGFGVPLANDSNIIISSAKEVHEFVYNRKASRVEIRQELNVSYLCNSVRTDLPVVEMYDNETTIDKVEASVDGRKLKDLRAAYEYYSVDNIFFSDARVCHFRLPLQKQGAVGEVKFEKTITDPRYFTSIYFTDVYAIKNKQVIIKVPRWMKIEFRELNFEGYTITKQVQFDSKADADVYTYNISNARAQQNEGNSPGPSYVYPHLLIMTKSASPAETSFTYFNSLKEQYSWYHSMVSTLENDATVIKAKAEEITAGKSTDMDKIKAIFYWVQHNIRYIAFEDGIAGFKPEKAHEVLRRKYGDCKGMANLTKSLLKGLGYDARLCWIGTNHIAYDYSTPNLSVDNHMICALNLGGKTYFLDATETYSSFNEYAERIQGRQVLVEDGKNYILTKIPATTFNQNIDAEKATLRINGTELLGTVEHEWRGEEKNALLNQLNNIKKDKSKEAFTRYLTRDNKDMLLEHFNTSDLDDIGQNLTAKYQFALKNGVSKFGKEYYVDMDFSKEYGRFVFDDKRTQDYWFSFKTNTSKEIQLAIPAGFKITSLPPNLDIKNADYEFKINYQQQAGKIIYKKSIIIKNPRLSKTKFAQWNKDVEQLARSYNEQVVLTAN
jgi:hypothetical protein